MDNDLRDDIEVGIVKISDEVVEVIAGLAAAEITGVVGMSASLVGGISQILSGKKNLSKGVKVNLGEDSASIDLYLVVKYGIKIPEVAAAVQTNVKKAVESMTGLSVSGVNVYVQNVILPKEEEVVEVEE
ncbi:alkaline shock protein [Clostridium pasteurianum DSM 525 = ATCC 6013]|uniref:Alkaline shock protein n=1 Tax=Clostridium pasteurianum DSM 525 = ATCC 6013 TaxID=1262449 RepID=A0A0H3J9U0_CLOPA|nr:Asp23/Gls24 family envelope stress response protein [Clostridium pasteurianum]AJA47975.1 alkaline shock protein [Clostridium pasteurianum DSM 525 = ATCC 6013]AJA51963.1 alkaline shock protein [Clostridium pasteurianum DSM 525 = ATCC 6013]AOZ75260.1 alkaline-shock protein [Clostridium pasteurianum DSM 525 = ATCC 6013]AOZ79055.1 alkaline-shock protein [Clostridium pasteurianum]ELP59878.1 alkaline shock protein [Clostridium pasteurianum DSM 525 = ATCC 6013]